MFCFFIRRSIVDDGDERKKTTNADTFVRRLLTARPQKIDGISYEELLDLGSVDITI